MIADVGEIAGESPGEGRPDGAGAFQGRGRAGKQADVAMRGGEGPVALVSA